MEQWQFRVVFIAMKKHANLINKLQAANEMTEQMK
jgi:hypothetical protein